MRRLALLLATALLATLLLGAAARAAAPLYDIKATWGDTHLPPGGQGQFSIQVRNLGDQLGKGDLTVTDELPVGVTATHIFGPFANLGGSYSCTGLGTETVRCVMPDHWVSEVPLPDGTHGLGQPLGTKTAQLFGLYPTGYLPPLLIDVAVAPDVGAEGLNTATVSGGGAGPATDADQIPFSATPAPFGVVPGSFAADVFDGAYPFGTPVRQAGGHPFEQRFDFDFNERSSIGSDGTRYITPSEQVKTVDLTLARGLIGNPEALPKCDPVDFAQEGSSFVSTGCPADTQIGYLNPHATAGQKNYGNGDFFFDLDSDVAHVPIYNLVPPKGTPVDLGFNAGVVQAHIFAELDPAQNYAIKSLTPNISSLAAVRGSEVVIWGVPGDPAHDKFRYYPRLQPNGDAAGAPFEGAAIRPFWTTPSDCGFDNGGARIRLDSYSHPGQFTAAEEYPEPLDVGGCEDPRFRFEPEVAIQPTDHHAGAPTGLDVHLKVPQRDDEVSEASKLYPANGFVEGITTPPMKKAVVTFPQGMTLSPSAAQGLGTCSASQIGLGTDSKVECPDDSQYGTLTLHTPILPAGAQPEGWVYIAKQSENPYGNFLSFYLVVQEPARGILVKIPFKAELDPQSGQITGTFDDLPQFPVSDLQMSLKGGARAGLVEPSTCGTKTINAEFFSWQDPATPHKVKNSYEVTEKADGSPCVKNLGERQFKPQMQAGTTSNSAGSFSPFAFHLTRTDDDQEFSQFALTLAPGLLAKLAGVGRCSEAGIAQAVSRTAAGDGALEQADPSCPGGSQIGTAKVGAGVGVPLTYVPGKLYLAGPYRGAPLSMVLITPALVGPYDLGVIAVRSALRINPDTSQATVATDPLPQIYQGIPVRIRDIRVSVDRPDFTLNPTNCDPLAIDANLTGVGGDLFSTADDSAIDLTERFQAADCAALDFKPKIFFKLSGGTHRGDHPAFFSRLRGRPGDANIGKAIVALPKTEFLENAHIGTICTRVQFAADSCPAASIYGHAKAITPLLDEPVEGPLYLRSSDHPLPDLVAKLRGQISANLVGRIDSVNGGIRSSFETVPDVPVSEFTLSMKGGEKGLLVNSQDLCKKRHRADVRFTSQSDRFLRLRPVVQNSCKKQRHPRRARHRRG